MVVEIVVIYISYNIKLGKNGGKKILNFKLLN